MAHVPTLIPRASIAVGMLAVTLVTIGCGDVVPTAPGPGGSSGDAGDPSLPSSSAAALATPLATPIDASSAFVATITDPGFDALVNITGQTRVGSVRYEIAGTLTIAGPDAELDLTTTAASRTSHVRTLSVDDNRYTMSAPPGMWFAVDDTAGAALAGALRPTAPDVTDAGPEVKDGVTLHHLVITPQDSLGEALGVRRDTYTSVTTTMEAWVEDDGSPVAVELHAGWTQSVNGKPVAVTKSMDLAFSELPAGTTLVAPDIAWQWNTSTRFKYRMAYPVGWTYKSGSSKYADAYYGFDTNAVFASRGGNKGLSLSQLSGALPRYLPQITSVKAPKVLSNKSGRLGPLPARRIEYTYSASGKRYYSLMYLAVSGSSYYVVEYETQHKTTDEDRALATRFAATFSPR